MASDVSPTISVVTPYSLLAIFPGLKENTLSACMVTALRASTATGMPVKKVHWLARISCDLGWSLSLQTNCTRGFLQLLQVNYKKYRKKVIRFETDSFLQCVCNHYTHSSYQLMVENECSWTALLKVL